MQKCIWPLLQQDVDMDGGENSTLLVTRRLLLNFFFELIVYGILLSIYFWLVLRLLAQPLDQLFRLNPVVYAVATLVLIVLQGVGLEIITTFLVERLGIETIK